ncbi:copper-binding protein [Thauera sp.]|uniref:copper-binding protein n=1 Tax=Thauera sp. TaxID=1905334 RepID=UPI002B9F4478|nr:copper-binding protein [Thauera sp.]HRP24962.1 copper-binding protein [Thauera sp.]
MKNLLAILATSLITASALADSHLPAVDAEVRRVDRNAGKLTLRHGHIPNLDMPPMTMVFTVREQALLDGVEPGDKVVVTVDQIDGAYVVQSLGKANR